jgi:hypothetical protein
MGTLPANHERGWMMANKARIARPVLALSWTFAFCLTSCAATNAFMGNHLDAAQKYRASAQQTEKAAHEQSVILNHLDAANKYGDAGHIRLQSAREYNELGNPAQAKQQFQKASSDFVNASNESMKAGGENP